MAASLEVLKEWFDLGVSQGEKYMIVATDNFDHEDYPVYSDADNYSKRLSKIMNSIKNISIFLM